MGEYCQGGRSGAIASRNVWRNLSWISFHGNEESLKMRKWAISMDFLRGGRPLGSEPVVVCQWKTEDE